MLLFGFLVVLAIALLLVMLGVAPVYPLQSRKNRIAQMCNGSVTVSFIGSTHSNTTLDAITVGAHLVPGAVIAGPGIPVGTTIVSYDYVAHSAVLSAAATATAAGVALSQVNPLNGGFNAKNFRLTKSAYNPQVSSVLADFTAIECDFAGYAPIVLNMALGYVDPGSLAIAQSQLLSFQPTDAVTPNSAYTWWVDDGTSVLLAGVFANPVALTGPTKELSCVLQDSFPSGAGLIQVVP